MLFRKNNDLKTILQLDEVDFRKSGSYGDMLISILKQREEDIKDNIMFIRTNLEYKHHHPVIQILNKFLKMIRETQNIIAIQVVLD